MKPCQLFPSTGKGVIMRSLFCRSIFPLFLISCIVRAGSVASNLHDSAITVSGSVHLGTGEVMRGMYHAMINGQGEQLQSWPSTVAHAWFGQPEAMLNLSFKPNDKMCVQIGFQGNVFLNTFPANFKSSMSSNGGEGVLPQYMSWTLHQAQGTISLLDNEAMSLGLSLGVMPYKYNPEVRNLGEFLFRSGTYPFFLINDYDFPLARLSGVRLNCKYVNEKIRVVFDQFVLSERTLPPFYDFSLASMVSVGWGKFVEWGAGVDFAHLFSVNSELTTPDAAKYAISPGDTGRYTFKGTKVMSRLTVDPCGILRGDKESAIGQLFGENGGKIYGEIAVIGLKNYPASFVKSSTDPRDALNQWGYSKISERMPWMVGFNIPLWKILDVCAFELEKYPAPYPNDYFQVLMESGLPVPTWYHVYRDNIRIVQNPSSGGYDTIPWKMAYDSAAYQNRWYWSLYMKKKIAEHFSLLGQISRDHMRWDINLGNKLNYDTEEALVLPGEWSWRFGALLEF